MHFAVQLLSPLGPENRSGNNNALLGHASMLYAALQGMHTTDALNVLSLFGMVILPECSFPLVLYDYLFFEHLSICMLNCISATL